MALFNFSLFFVTLLLLSKCLKASTGDADPIYINCIEQCTKTGCIKDYCFENCDNSSTGKPKDGTWYLQESVYGRMKELSCHSDCKYRCMLSREAERQKLGEKPIKYHGKWPLRRFLGIQEPLSLALSVVNLVLVFHGWMCLFFLLYYKLPLRRNGKTFYEYTGLWHVYAILSMVFWFWSTVFHIRYVDLIEKLYYSSGLASLGFALLISIIRTLNMKTEASRVMVAAPIIGFMTTHILFLNVVELHYGFNMVVVSILITTQLLFLAIWAICSHHPSKSKLWVVVGGGAISILLDIIDFPPFKGLIDAHALSQAISAPLTYIWWSFIRDDAIFITSSLAKKKK